jgi:tRNA(Ile)-lysidine synthase
MDFSDHLKPYLTKKAKNYYVALSGGADSLVLLNELKKLQKDNDFNLIAIHINHNVQKDSKKWKSICENLCKKNEIKLITHSLKRKKNSSSNLEKKLRDERYRFFEKTLEKNSILFMGHHLDDVIETFFLRALRGSGIEGLSSIPKERTLGKGKLIRPFLNISKSEILAKAKKDKLKFIKDPSNKDNSFDRNYLRNEVLPKIEKRWPSYRKNLNQLTRNLKESSDLLTMQAEKDFNDVKLKKDLISLQKFLYLSKIRQKNVFIFWINLNRLNQPSAKVINLFFSKFLKDEKTPKAKYIWGTASKKGSVSITKNTKELRISELSA